MSATRLWTFVLVVAYGFVVACCAVYPAQHGASLAEAVGAAPSPTVAAVSDIPCTSEAPTVVGETSGEESNAYRIVAVEGCGQRLTYMVRGDGESTLLIGRVPIGGYRANP